MRDHSFLAQDGFDVYIAAELLELPIRVNTGMRKDEQR